MKRVSLRSWRYCKRTRNKVTQRSWQASDEAARSTGRGVFLAAKLLASGGSAAKTLFRAHHTANYAG